MPNLLLTSGGLTTSKIIETLAQRLTVELGEAKVAFIITASLGETGDKAWLVKDLNNLYMAGVAEVDIVDIAGLSKEEWLPKLEWADVIWAEGGNTKFLMYHIEKSGLKDELPKLLENRLYVGVSAGSMVMGECLPSDAEAKVYPDDKFVEPYKSVHKYLGYIPIHIMPHYRSEFFNTSDDDMQSLTEFTQKPIYALDDTSALVVEGGDVKRVVTDGAWKIFLKGDS